MSAEAGPEDVYHLVGADLVGRFHVDDIVAEGGFGVVYRGVQLGLDRPVAIKVLKTPDDPKHAEIFLSTFRQEARTIAKLQHPAIVQVLDFGTSVMPSGVEAPFMVLEWINGQSLEALLDGRKGKGGRPPAECLELFRSVFEAVDVAHQAGVAHRDLKPPNVMVVETPRGQLLRLLDFGIAKIMADDPSAPVSGMTRTSSGASAYSPRYAAPEQVASARTGPWTDVHALGLLLVEALTDQSAYQSDDVTGLFRLILSPERPTPARLNLDVGTWEQVIGRALAPHPGDRHQTAGAFLQALVEALPGATHQWNTPSGDTATPLAQPHGVVSTELVQSLPPGALSSTVSRGIRTIDVPVAPARSRTTMFVVGAAVVVLAGAFGLRAILSESNPETTQAPNFVSDPPGIAPITPVAAAIAPTAPAPTSPAAPTAAVADAGAERANEEDVADDHAHGSRRRGRGSVGHRSGRGRQTHGRSEFRVE